MDKYNPDILPGLTGKICLFVICDFCTGFLKIHTLYLCTAVDEVGLYFNNQGRVIITDKNCSLWSLPWVTQTLGTTAQYIFCSTQEQNLFSCISLHQYIHMTTFATYKNIGNLHVSLLDMSRTGLTTVEAPQQLFFG